MSSPDPLEARLRNAIITARVINRWPCGVTIDEGEEHLVADLLVKLHAEGWAAVVANDPHSMTRRPYLRVDGEHQ